VESGAWSAGGAVYRRTVAPTGRRWHNCALRHGKPTDRTRFGRRHRPAGARVGV